MPKITVKDLIAQLEMHNPDDVVCFGSDSELTFDAVKGRGGVTQILFEEKIGEHYQLLPNHPKFKPSNK